MREGPRNVDCVQPPLARDQRTESVGPRVCCDRTECVGPRVCCDRTECVGPRVCCDFLELSDLVAVESGRV